MASNSTMAVEPERVTLLNEAPERPEREYVLYWAQMNRRVDANHGLLYAVELANGTICRCCITKG